MNYKEKIIMLVSELGAEEVDGNFALHQIKIIEVERR